MTSSSPFPPTNTTPPYGPISLLPELSSFRPGTNLTVTFTGASSNLDSKPVAASDDAHAASSPLRTNSGQKLSWLQTQAQPSISFRAEAGHSGATYTLLMTDPDAPTPHDTKYAYWRHWIQPGLQPSVSAPEEAKSTKSPLTEYLAPGKKEPSAEPHRYILLLCREPAPGHHYHSLTKADVGAENFEARRAFDAKGWVESNDLELVAVEWFWGTG